MKFLKADTPISVESYEAMDKAFAFNGSDIELDPDLMHIRFILCHEGVNANGDYFTKEVLQAAQFTPRNKPVNWEHGQPVIGNMIDSVYKEDASGRGYIEAVGLVWKFLYPELSGSIKSKAATGELKLSMECYYKEANYSVGETLYTQAEAEKLGLTQYVGREYMGNKVTRVFNSVLFGGVGVVANPADKEAVFLSVARDLGAHGINTDGASVEELQDISSAIAEAINRAVNDFTKKTVDKDTINAVTVAKYVKAFDRAKGSIVGKFNKDETKTKEQFVSEVRTILDSFLTEVAGINENYYRGLASDDSATASEVFYEDIMNSLSRKLFTHYQGFSESIDAYLLRVAEDYFIYELIDYSLPYPEGKKLLKGYYSLVDNEVAIHFDKAVEVEQIYVEKASENLDKEETDEMSKQSQAQENEVPVVEPVAVVADETVVDYQAQATSLASEVVTLTEQLEAEKTAKAGLETKIAELQLQLDEIEAEKVYASRLAELESFNLSDKRKASIKGMTEEAFADLKELLGEVAVAQPVVEATPVVEAPVVEAVASVDEEEVDEEEDSEITVENVKASAVNIEAMIPKDYKPFSHLR